MPSDSISSSPSWDLGDLPRARNPLRWLTGLTLAATLVASFLSGAALAREAAFAWSQKAPIDVGHLGSLRPSEGLTNRWVRSEATLEARFIDYRRALESSRYRLFPVRGAPNLFVQVEVPGSSRDYVVPTSFVGRLLPLSKLGLYHQGLGKQLEERLGAGREEGWVLLDGESPASFRWALGWCALCGVFASFCALGLFRLFWPTVREAHEEAEARAG